MNGRMLDNILTFQKTRPRKSIPTSDRLMSKKEVGDTPGLMHHVQNDQSQSRSRKFEVQYLSNSRTNVIRILLRWMDTLDPAVII